MAITLRRRSMKVATALATPTPPTRRAVRPKKGQELAETLERPAYLWRGIAAVGDGEAGIGERRLGALPECGESGGAFAGLVRQLQSVAPAHERARLHEAGPLQCRHRDEDARTVCEAVGDGVGLRDDGGVHGHLCIADLHRVAGLQPKSLEEHGIGDGAVSNRFVEGCARDLELTCERIRLIDRLELDQGLVLAVEPTGHGTKRRRLADASLSLDPFAIGAVGAGVHAREGHVAAEDRFALALEAAPQRFGKCADGGDHGNAECHAGDEHVEAPQATAQLAHGKRDDAAERDPPPGRQRIQGPRCAHAAAAF